MPRAAHRTCYPWMVAALACLQAGCVPPAAHSRAVKATDAVIIAAESHKGMHVVPVMVNGQGPFRIAVDTGAPGPLRLDRTVAAKLGLKTVGHDMHGDGSGQNETAIPITTIETLAISSFHKSNLEAHVLDLGKQGFKGMDGVFGMDVFSDSLLTLDFDRNVVEVETGTLPAPDGATVFEYPPREDGLIELTIEVAGQPVKVILDTGQVSSAGLSLPAAVAASVAGGPPTQAGEGRTAFNSFKMFEVELEGPVTIGSLTLPVTKARYRDGAVPPESLWAAYGNLGAAALKGAKLRIDQVNRRLQILF